MEFQKWDDEEDYGNLMEWFTNKAKEPKNFEKYKDTVREGFEDFKEVFGLETDVDFVIAETNIDFLREKYDEIPDWAYGQGFSTTPEWHDVDTPTVFVMANDQYEYWEDLLKYVAAHELGHQKLYENHEKGRQIYKRMMFEGHAMHSAEKLAEEKNYNWSQNGWSPGKVNKEELLRELDKFNTWAGENEGETTTLFVPGGEEWQNAEGYPIAFQTTKMIIEQQDESVSELLEMSFDEWREKLEKSIEDKWS